jgi:hypothetical protein
MSRPKPFSQATTLMKKLVPPGGNPNVDRRLRDGVARADRASLLGNAVQTFERPVTTRQLETAQAL